MTEHCDDSAGCPWSEREAQLLAITLELLQEHGYDRLTVDAVAAKAKASKATVYRRWPSKADLVLAALVEGTRADATAPRTGSLRGDLLEIGRTCCKHTQEHMRTLRAVLNEMSHNPALQDVMQEKFVLQRRWCSMAPLPRPSGAARLRSRRSPKRSTICYRDIWCSGPWCRTGHRPTPRSRPSSIGCCCCC